MFCRAAMKLSQSGWSKKEKQYVMGAAELGVCSRVQQQLMSVAVLVLLAYLQECAATSPEA
jgi:hypothetical protein